MFVIQDMGKRETRGQVWVETMIYTMVAFFMIGIVLAFVRPKILEFQDRVIIERSVNTMDEIHQNVLSVARGGEGNRRVITIDVKKGSFKINGTDDVISLEIHESHYEYSEPGQGVNVGHDADPDGKIGRPEQGDPDPELFREIQSHV